MDSKQEGTRPARSTLSELRLLSGLTWDQVADLLGVSRHEVHLWISGKPIGSDHERLLGGLFEVISFADRGSAGLNRLALFEAREGITPFGLLAEGRVEEARARLGQGPGRRRPKLEPLSAAAQAARMPLPPEELVDARQNPIHGDPGGHRPARTTRTGRAP